MFYPWIGGIAECPGSFLAPAANTPIHSMSEKILVKYLVLEFRLFEKKV